MKNDYIPQVVKIERSVSQTPEIKTFYLKRALDFTPGQFLEVSYFGAGEAPISISSSPREESLRITFRRSGDVTKALFNLKKNDSLGIRGPFGNGFSLAGLEQKNLIFIAGGLGLAPLRSMLKFILARKDNRPKSIALLYGARSPQEMLYKKEFREWGKDVNLILTIDNPESGWSGRTGVVTELLNEIKIDPQNTIAYVCGPGIMIHFVSEKLLKLGIDSSNIIVSLERYMKCGVGKCGHCYIADKFVCRDGPVFSYRQLDHLIPAEIL